MEPIRLVVADDHDGFRRTLINLLALDGDLEIVGEASNGQEAYDLCLGLLPDVALLDLSMPIMDGAEATQRIKRSAPKSKVIIFTVFTEEGSIRKALEAGADRYLTKGVSRPELIATIKAVAGEPKGSPAPMVAGTAVLIDDLGGSR